MISFLFWTRAVYPQCLGPRICKNSFVKWINKEQTNKWMGEWMGRYNLASLQLLYQTCRKGRTIEISSLNGSSSGAGCILFFMTGPVLSFPSSSIIPQPLFLTLPHSQSHAESILTWLSKPFCSWQSKPCGRTVRRASAEIRWPPLQIPFLF